MLFSCRRLQVSYLSLPSFPYLIRIKLSAAQMRKLLAGSARRHVKAKFDWEERKERLEPGRAGSGTHAFHVRLEQAVQGVAR